MNTTRKTAPETYEDRRSDIKRVMDWIALELDRHRTCAKAHPGDWGYAGDLGHVRGKLIETLAFLTNSEPEEIEEQLGEGR